jgi:hypothetical protein
MAETPFQTPPQFAMPAGVTFPSEVSFNTPTLPLAVPQVPQDTAAVVIQQAVAPVALKSKRLLEIERCMVARRQRVKTLIDNACKEQGLCKPDGTNDLDKYVKFNDTVNIYTKYPVDTLIKEIAELKSREGGIPYWKLHPAAISGQYRDAGKTKVKDAAGKISEIAKSEIYWYYNQSNGDKLSTGPFCITLPACDINGIEFSTKLAEKEKDGKIVKEPYNLWEVTIELLPSDLEHMFAREVLQDLELGMANTWIHHVGKMSPNVQFNVNNPTSSGMRGLTWFFSSAGTSTEQRNQNVANIKAKLVEKENRISKSTRTVFYAPPTVPADKLPLGSHILDWDFLRTKLIRCVPTIRVLRTSNAGKNGSVAFELVSACVLEIKGQAGIEAAKEIMDELIADDESIGANFSNSLKSFEDEIKSFIPGRTPPATAIPSATDVAVNNNMNIVSDISQLGNSVAGLVGGTPQIPQNGGSPGPYPPPSSLPTHPYNGGGSGTAQGFSMPNPQAFSASAGQIFAPPQQHGQAAQPGAPSMVNYGYGGPAGQTQFAQTYAQ